MDTRLYTHARTQTLFLSPILFFFSLSLSLLFQFHFLFLSLLCSLMIPVFLFSLFALLRFTFLFFSPLAHSLYYETLPLGYLPSFTPLFLSPLSLSSTPFLFFISIKTSIEPRALGMRLAPLASTTMSQPRFRFEREPSQCPLGLTQAALNASKAISFLIAPGDYTISILANQSLVLLLRVFFPSI